MRNKIFITFFLLFATSFSIFSQTVTVTIVYSGAQSQGCCNVCGIDYWCINNTGGCGSPSACDNKSFFDPIPAGNIITSVSVTYFGAGCYATTETTSINGVPVGSAPNNANCSCGACDAYTTPATSFACGLPSYNYGGNNTLTCCPDDAFCPQRAVITFTYGPSSGSSVPSVAPTSATANPSSICGSATTTLNVTGGSLGTGATWNWYSGSCGGVPEGTGTFIIVSPAATTTYFVRAQGTCNTTACVSVTVTIGVPSVAPVSATASPNATCGGPTTLSVTGGSLGTGASWNWYSGSCSGTSVGTGASITVSPSATTTYFVRAQGTCNITACASVIVTVNSTPFAIATPASLTICSGDSASIALSSFTPGTAFSWTATQTGVTGASAGLGAAIVQTLTASGTSQGTVVYTITPAANGCNGNPINVTVAVNPIPVVTATPTAQTSCSGTANSIILNSNIPGATFAWTVSQTGVSGGTNASGSTITDVLSTTGGASGTAIYTITPTANGCSGTPLTTTITVNSDPGSTATAIPASPTICSGNTTSVVLSSLTPGTTFSWTVSQTGVSGASAGSGSTIVQALTTTGISPGTATYTITPTANGCIGNQLIVIVTVNPIPAATATPTAQTICSGASTSVALTSTNQGTTFNWAAVQTGVSGASNASGPTIAEILTVTGSVTGNAVYTITPTANGCSGTTLIASITVGVGLTVTVNSPTICIGETATLTAAGGLSYIWSTGSTANSITDAPVISTSYTVAGTNGACTDTTIATVTIGSNLTITVNSPSICAGETGTLTAEGAASYLWSTGSTANPFVITPDSTTSYSVTGTATGACPGIATSIVTVNPLPDAAFNANSFSGCAPLCVTFLDTSGVIDGNIAAWNWNFGGDGTSTIQNPQHCFNDAGQYSITLTATSNTGCSNTLTNTNMISISPFPVAEFYAPLSSSILNPTISFTDHSIGASSWNWDFDDPLDSINNNSSEENPTHIYAEVGDYCVTLIVSNATGCLDSNQRCFSITPELVFYIPSAFSPNGDGKNDEFYVKGENTHEFELSVYDRWGNMIFSTKDINEHWNGKAKGSNMAIQDVYVYLVIIKDNNNERYQYIGSVTIVR